MTVLETVITQPLSPHSDFIHQSSILLFASDAEPLIDGSESLLDFSIDYRPL